MAEPKKHPPTQRKLAAGFTLIEVMAALAILSIAIVILFRIQTQSLSSVIRVTDYEKAVFMTENLLHWTFLDLNQSEDWRDYSSLSGEDLGFNWTVTVEQVDSDNDIGPTFTASLLRVRAVTTWPQGRGEGVYELETWYLWGEEE